MGEFADQALSDILDDMEAWDGGEFNISPEDGYPMYYPFGGDGNISGILRRSKAKQAIKSGNYDGFNIEIV